MSDVATEPPPAPKSRSRAPLTGPRVLVADDNSVVLQVAVAMLSQMGCRVLAVSGGLLALEALSTGDFDLAFVDCRMPDLDGMRAVRAFRELEQGRGGSRLPIVALSGNVEVSDRIECREAGMDGFLGKPFGQLDLLDTVRRFVPNAVQPSGQPAAPVHRVAEPKTHAAIDTAVLDQLEVMRPGLRARVFALFLRDSPSLVRAIATAAEVLDEVELTRAAHRLKSGAGNLGARRMVQLCDALEAIGRGNDAARAVELAAELSREFASVTAEMELLSRAMGDRT
jgi:two-component system sensor histidine kinase/response regulator